jgi:hypothetical protein
LTFRGLFQVIKSNKPSNIFFFLEIRGFLMKLGREVIEATEVVEAVEVNEVI